MTTDKVKCEYGACALRLAGAECVNECAVAVRRKAASVPDPEPPPTLRRGASWVQPGDVICRHCGERYFACSKCRVDIPFGLATTQNEDGQVVVAQPSAKPEPTVTSILSKDVKGKSLAIWHQNGGVCIEVFDHRRGLMIEIDLTPEEASNLKAAL